jgi:hypothetical protein
MTRLSERCYIYNHQELREQKTNITYTTERISLQVSVKLSTNQVKRVHECLDENGRH